jgi:hypothetical protein
MKIFTIALLVLFGAAQASEITLTAGSVATSLALGALAEEGDEDEAQERSVADVEQLRDEYVFLYRDIADGSVTAVEDVRQPSMKEWFLEIQDSPAIKKVRASSPGLSDLEVLSKVAAEVLFNQQQ